MQTHRVSKIAPLILCVVPSLFFLYTARKQRAKPQRSLAILRPGPHLTLPPSLPYTPSPTSPRQKNFQQAQERRRRVDAMRDPHHLLLVEGRACKVLRQGPQQQQLESSLMPWQGRTVREREGEKMKGDRVLAYTAISTLFFILYTYTYTRVPEFDDRSL